MPRGPTQRTDEWYEVRRRGITSTDIPAILGLSPYKSEADVALEKQGIDPAPPDDRTARRLRMGQALETLIRDEDEWEHGIKLRRVRRIITSRDIPWAMASLDFERVGERTIVEAKSSRAGRWDEGVPEDVEAQVRWQMGVAGYPRAHIALLRHGSDLVCYDIDHDQATFDGLLRIGEDFMRRLAAGGPFSENAASVRRRYPADNGAEMDADYEMDDLITSLLEARSERVRLTAVEDDIETRIKQRMGEVALVRGRGYQVRWRRTRDGTQTDWERVARDTMAAMPEPDRAAVVGRYTTVRPGFRPFRVVLDKEDGT